MVFLLTVGRDMDERGTLGVYSTEAKALARARALSDPYWEIEAFELDASDYGDVIVWTEYDGRSRTIVERRPSPHPAV
jgi:hypothetical protein